MYLEFKDERDKDFIEAYEAVVRGYGSKAPFIKKEVLLSEAIFKGAKRFYVSIEQASRIISRLVRGEYVDFKNSLKKEMYLTILEKVEKLKTQKPGIPLSAILPDVIYSPAPRFYITEESATILFYELLKGRR